MRQCDAAVEFQPVEGRIGGIDFDSRAAARRSGRSLADVGIIGQLGFERHLEKSRSDVELRKRRGADSDLFALAGGQKIAACGNAAYIVAVKSPSGAQVNFEIVERGDDD